jgi:hypothetical protein
VPSTQKREFSDSAAVLRSTFGRSTRDVTRSKSHGISDESLQLLKAASDMALRGGSLLSLVGDGDRRHMVEAVSAAKLGTGGGASREMFAPIVSALESRFLAAVTAFLNGQPFARNLRGYVCSGCIARWWWS